MTVIKQRLESKCNCCCKAYTYLLGTVRQSLKSRESILSNSNVDLSQIPPCKKVFNLHIARANFRALVRRNVNAQFPEIPDANKKRWKQGCSGGLEIKSFYDDYFPRDLQNIWTQMNSDNDEEYREDDNETEQFSSEEESTCRKMDSSGTNGENQHVKIVSTEWRKYNHAGLNYLSCELYYILPFISICEILLLAYYISNHCGYKTLLMPCIF